MRNLEHSCKIKGYHLDMIDCQGQLYAPLKTPLPLFCLRVSQLWIHFNSEWSPKHIIDYRSEDSCVRTMWHLRNSYIPMVIYLQAKQNTPMFCWLNWAIGIYGDIVFPTKVIIIVKRAQDHKFILIKPSLDVEDFPSLHKPQSSCPFARRALILELLQCTH